MQEVSDELHRQTGLRLEIWAGPDFDEKYFRDLKIHCLTEEVLQKNLTDDEIEETVFRYIRKISELGCDELIVLDPYLYRKPREDETDIAQRILRKCEFRNIITVTNKKHADKRAMKSLTEEMNGKLKVRFLNDFHDRIWIANRSSGFLTGTSLNGIGKKYCTILELEEQDVKDIVEILIHMKIIQRESPKADTLCETAD